MKARLTMWKTSHLSFAGRVTLAKSVLEAILIYNMMSAKIPRTCLDDIQKIQRNFIWGDSDQKRRWHAVAWDVVTLSKKLGGLELRKLTSMNKACVLKLGWNLASQSTYYCCRVLREKYGRNDTPYRLAKRNTDSELWKNLVELQPLQDQFSYWIVGDGAKIDAWNHAWIELDLVFTHLVQVPATLFGVTVKDLTTSTGTWNWNILEGWLPEEILNKITAKLPPRVDQGEDVRAFEGDAALECSVFGLYSHICGFGNSIVQDFGRCFGKLNVPERVWYFTWLVLHGRIIMNMKKKMMGLGHRMCRYCGDVERIVIHILREFPLATNIWCQLVTSDNIC